MPRIVHLGLGAFHRAHQAVYLQRLHDSGDRAWTLASGNIRPDGNETVAALQAQGGRYTLETVDADGSRAYDSIDAIAQVLPWDESLSAFIAAGADAQTRIISFTVTEAGYALQPDDRLDTAAPDICSDLALLREGRAGSTLYGALVAMLRARIAAQAGPVTLLCCDNLRHNGERSRKGLLQFIEAAGDMQLLRWVQENTSSPNAMVDRITPRPTPEVAARVLQATGRRDGAAVMSERFIQWVIEDRFIAGRPAWESVGIEMVADVDPYEEAKIRLLNATHSCVAWAGALAGCAFVHEAVANARIRQFAIDYANHDAIPALSPSPIDLHRYHQTVVERFSNAVLMDTTQRILADSYAKLATFVAPTVADRLARAQSLDAVAMLPALYLACLLKWRRGQLPFDYEDKALDEATAAALCDGPDPVLALCSDTRLWGACAGAPELLAALRPAWQRVAGFGPT